MRLRGDGEQTYTCSANVVARYQKCISALLDRIDIHAELHLSARRPSRAQAGAYDRQPGRGSQHRPDAPG